MVIHDCLVYSHTEYDNITSYFQSAFIGVQKTVEIPAFDSYKSNFQRTV